MKKRHLIVAGAALALWADICNAARFGADSWRHAWADTLQVVARDTRPPHYGVQGYAVIDFNEKEPILIAPAEGQRPRAPPPYRQSPGITSFSSIFLQM